MHKGVFSIAETIVYGVPWTPYNTLHRLNYWRIVCTVHIFHYTHPVGIDTKLHSAQRDSFCISIIIVFVYRAIPQPPPCEEIMSIPNEALQKVALVHHQPNLRIVNVP